MATHNLGFYKRQFRSLKVYWYIITRKLTTPAAGDATNRQGSIQGSKTGGDMGREGGGSSIFTQAVDSPDTPTRLETGDGLF
jgi:hypothetical protein